MAISVGNVATTATTIYTSSGSSAITWCSLTNYSVANTTINVYVVPNGGTPGTTNIIASALLVTAGDTYQLYAGSEKLLLSAGDFVSVTAVAANSITAVTSYTAI
jgi:hypothetical protein